MTLCTFKDVFRCWLMCSKLWTLEMYMKCLSPNYSLRPALILKYQKMANICTILIENASQRWHKDDVHKSVSAVKSPIKVQQSQMTSKPWYKLFFTYSCLISFDSFSLIQPCVLSSPSVDVGQANLWSFSTDYLLQCFLSAFFVLHAFSRTFTFGCLGDGQRDRQESCGFKMPAGCLLPDATKQSETQSISTF